MAAQIRHSMPPLKQQVLDSFKYSVTNELSQTPLGLFDATQTNEVDRIFSTPPSLRAIPSSVSARTDGVRVTCGDNSPYSTVHQVIPGEKESSLKL